VSFLRHGIQRDWKDTISGVQVHVSRGSAETLVRRGGITNRRLIAFSLSNISAINYQNQLMCVEIKLCNTSVVFRHRVVWQLTSMYSRCFGHCSMTELMRDCMWNLFEIIVFYCSLFDKELQKSEEQQSSTRKLQASVCLFFFCLLCICEIYWAACFFLFCICT